MKGNDATISAAIPAGLDRALYTSSAFRSHQDFWSENLRRCTLCAAHLEAAVGETAFTITLTQNEKDALQSLSEGSLLKRLIILYSALTLTLSRWQRSEVVTLITPQLTAGPTAVGDWPLPVSVQVPQGISANDLKAEVLTQLRGAYSHQDYPWQLIADVTGDAPKPAFALVDPALHRHEKINAPVVLTMKECDDGLSLEVRLSDAKLSKDAGKRLVRRALKLLSSFDEEERPLTGADLLFDDEAAQLEEFSRGRKSSCEPTTLVDLISAASAANQRQPCVVESSGTVNYGELDLLVDRIAAYLAKVHCIGDGDVVAIAVDRSADAIAAMIAIMKCGATYLPLDLSWPIERVSRVLQNANASLLVIDAIRMDVVPENLPLFVLDLEIANLPTQSQSFTSRARPDGAAYIMVTSGSTGEPKSVVVEQQAIANMVRWRCSFYELTSADISLQIPPATFDSSVSDIFSFLAAGATLLLPDEARRLDPSHLALLIMQHQPTHIMLVPSVYTSLLSSLPEELATLKCLTVAGESVSDALVSAHHTKCPKVRFVNEYGPAENAVCSTAADLQPGHPVTIGRPIENTEVFIALPDDSPAPIGYVGEIWLAGAGLARGYLDNSLTKARFGPHPWQCNRRIFRTGDLGRWTEDGQVEFVGRVDAQIKLRGVRIEPNEISSELHAAADLIDAQPVAYNIDGESSLLALVVPRPGAVIDENTIRARLAHRLPHIMVPRFILPVDAMPVTANGKFDPAAVSELVAHHFSTLDEPPTDLKTPTEKALSAIFGRIFDSAATFGGNSNYFSAGGDSIRSIQLIAEIEQTFGVTLALQDVYENPTIADLAQLIDLRPVAWNAAAVPEPKAEPEIVPASAIALGMIYHAAQHPGSGIYHDQTVIRFDNPNFTPDRFVEALELIVARHGTLRSSFRFASDTPAEQVILPAVQIDIPLTDWSEESLQEVDALLSRFLADDILEPFDIDVAPLWRARLFRLPDSCYAICFSLHHAILDGWSSAVFWEEVHSAYCSLMANMPVALPPLACSQSEYLAEQSAIAKDPEVLAFWQTELAGVEPLSLGRVSDDAAGPIHVNRLSIQPDLSDDVGRLAAELGASRKAVYFSAFLDTLALFSFEREFVVGIVESARPSRPGADRILGCFLNTVPYRHRSEAESSRERILHTFKSLGERTRAVRLPLPAIQSALGRGRERRAQLFEIVFGFVDFHLVGDELREFGRVMSDLSNDRSNTPLDFVISATGGKVELIINARLDYVSRMLVDELGELYLKVLRTITDQPDLLINRRELLNDTDWCKRGTAVQIADENLIAPCLHHMQLYPEAVAVIDSDGIGFSYGELQTKVEKIAKALRDDNQVGPGDRVGLFLPRSVDAIAACVATLAVGAAFIPIDTGYPPERISKIFADARIKSIITNSDLMFNLGEQAASLCVVDLLETDCELNTLHLPADRDPAYIIYTSGTTGTPKGVIISHGGAANMVRAQIGQFAITSDDIVGQFASLTFDAAISEIFTALGAGATLAIVPDECRRDIGKLEQFLTDSQISVLTLPPSLLALLDRSALRGLKTLVSAGEALPAKTAARIPQGVSLKNAYGPTEASVCATIHDVTDRSSIASEIPIGQPIANTELLILDCVGQPLAHGARGEIYLAGAGLAIGYTQAADESGKFLDHPFDSNRRIYRTGDFGLINDIGALCFRGRTDNQVKLRGFRIELDEVSQTLRSHPQVGEAIAFIDKFDRLCAAVTLVDSARIHTTDGEFFIEKTVKLPNGLLVAHQNHSETLALYDEIFEKRVYMRHGINLQAGDRVIDAGANIGLFSLFAHNEAEVEVLAFEPIPSTCRILAENMAAYRVPVRIIEAGLGATDGAADFYFYPNNTALSGRYADETEDRQLVRDALRSTHENVDDGAIDVVLRERITAEKVGSRLRRLSSVINELGIDKVDLLKIDVEKSEVDLLTGIEETDWGKIGQLVIEVHDIQERAARIRELLESLGFIVFDEQEDNANLVMIYASRPAYLERASAEPKARPEQVRHDLLGRCRRILPAYMQPAEILIVNELPLNHHGKVDVKALIDQRTSTFEKTGEAPRSSAESKMLFIWQRVLGMPSLGVEDRFFESGGHSLGAVQLCAEIGHAFGVELSISTLFENDSVRTVTPHVLAASARTLPEIRPQVGDASAPASRHQLRVLAASSGDADDYGITTAFLVHGKLDLKRLAAAVEQIVERHDVLRTHFNTDAAGQIIQQVANGSTLTGYFETLRPPLPGTAKSIAADLVERERARGFDLFADPLFRMVVCPVENETHVVLLSQHHAITDGWSLGILIDELGRAYQGQSLGKLPIQYGDFAAWHDLLLTSEWAERQRSAWLKRFADGVPRTRLPGEHSERMQAQSIERRLLSETGAWLSAPSSSTPIRRLLQAVYLFLYRELGQRRLVIGSPHAARPLVELQDQVGLYANTLPHYLEVQSSWSIDDLDEAVAELIQSNMDASLFPLDLIVETLRGAGHLAEDHSLFDVGVTWTGNDRAPVLGELKTSLVATPAPAVKADVWIYVGERDGVTELSLEYDSGRFSSKQIEGWATALEKIINLLAQGKIAKVDDVLGLALEPQPSAPSPTTRLLAGLGGQRKNVRSGNSPCRLDRLHANLAPIWQAVRPLSAPGSWLVENWEQIERDLTAHGAVLLRNFGLSNARGLSAAIESVGVKPHSYIFRSTPRTAVVDGVYSATEYPADQEIPLHNENAYSIHWPSLLWFFCETAADSGGETPLADCRQVFKSISSDLRREFIDKGLRYERNFHAELDLSWQDVFQTDQRETMEAIASSMDIDVVWRADGLPTIRHNGPVIETHPTTGEIVWFNQAHLFHPSSLGKEVARELGQITGGLMPRTVRFGDGSEIPRQHLDLVRNAYRDNLAASPWQAGDLLLVDNLLVAHGRRPFRGPRSVHVAMTDMPVAIR